MGIALAAVAVCAFALLGLLVAWSPGTPAPVLDSPGLPDDGGISEKIHVPINGVEQGMVIKSRGPEKPVLLYLHGGMPDYFLTQDYPTGLDDQFTVVWWDQRGSGLSFHPDIPQETMTPDQIVDDTIEVTNYLRRRFRQDKIYLMAHSGGTFVGIQAVAREPQLYHAYIAVAQMSHQIESEQLAHEYMLRRYREDGNTRMARRLQEAPVGDRPPMPRAYSNIRDIAMHDLGVGTCRDMRSIVTGLLLRSLQFREYTLGEKIALWRGKVFSGRLLWNQMLGVDLRKRVQRLEVPVYFLHGKHDYTVSYLLAKGYFDELEAPTKGFYTFDESAHSPIFEEPGKVADILGRDVLTGRAEMADSR